MIQDAVTAGLLLQQPLETRLTQVIETGTSTRQQTKHGNKQSTGSTGPTLRTQQCRNSNIPVRLLKMMTAKMPRKCRLSAPQLQAQLLRLSDSDTRPRRLKNTLFTKGARQQVMRIQDLCHTHVSHQWLYHLDACAGSVLTPHDYITKVQKGLVRAGCVVPSWTHSWNTERLAAPPKPHEDTTLVFTPSWVD